MEGEKRGARGGRGVCKDERDVQKTVTMRGGAREDRKTPHSPTESGVCVCARCCDAVTGCGAWERAHRRVGLHLPLSRTIIGPRAATPLKIYIFQLFPLNRPAMRVELRRNFLISRVLFRPFPTTTSPISYIIVIFTGTLCNGQKLWRGVCVSACACKVKRGLLHVLCANVHTLRNVIGVSMKTSHQCKNQKNKHKKKCTHTTHMRVRVHKCVPVAQCLRYIFDCFYETHNAFPPECVRTLAAATLSNHAIAHFPAMAPTRLFHRVPPRR